MAENSEVRVVILNSHGLLSFLCGMSLNCGKNGLLCYHPVSLLHLHSAWNILSSTKRDGDLQDSRSVRMNFVLWYV